MTFLRDWQTFLDNLPGVLLSLLLRLLLAALLFGVTYLLTRWTQRVVRRLAGRRPGPGRETLARALSRLVGIGGFTLAVIWLLAALGVDVAAIVAALGLTSVALGFALKDTIEQAITGVFLLFQQPFRVGDVIQVGEVEGIVTDIAIRTTNLRTYDGLHVLVPNNKVYQSVIINKSVLPRRRFALNVGLAYGTDLAEAQRVIAAAVSGTAGVLNDPAPAVSFETFDASSIGAVVRYWFDQTQTDGLALKTAVTQAILSATAGAGIEIPYPIQTVIVQSPGS